MTRERDGHWNNVPFVASICLGTEKDDKSSQFLTFTFCRDVH